MTLYGPNSDNTAFYENIFTHIDEIGNSDFTICGDYNLVLDPNMDSYNYKHVNNPKACDKLLGKIYEKNIVDPFRETFPLKKCYTWRKRNLLKQARLDYFLVSETTMQYVKQTKIESSYRSDHSPIVLELQFTNFNQGKGYWKHNNSLLSDKDYLKIINKRISEIKAQYALPVYNFDDINNIPAKDIQFTINDQLFLDVLLMELRGTAISYSSHKNKLKNIREQELLSNIKK